jgi:hypothetical protein
MGFEGRQGGMKEREQSETQGRQSPESPRPALAEDNRGQSDLDKVKQAERIHGSADRQMARLLRFTAAKVSGECAIFRNHNGALGHSQAPA